MIVLKIQLVVVSITFAFMASAQVGIGTTNPQAILEVDGGNVRFSEYGTNVHAATGIPPYLLGVEADGDIVEVNVDVPGLQFYGWGPVRTSSTNVGFPGPDIIDINEIFRFVDGGAPALGSPDISGIFTGPFDLVTAGLNFLRPNNNNNNYLLVFTGTLVVQNTGDFTFLSNSDDGSRIFIDEALIMDDWINQSQGSIATSTVTLAAGRHDIEFWYYQLGGGRRIQFSWGANPDGYGVGTFIQASQFVIE